MRNLARDEYSYKAERAHLDDATPCRCGGCDSVWRYDQLAEIGDCSLTPGDPSPAGRCADPSCDTLAYPEAPEKLAAETYLDRFPAEHRASAERAARQKKEDAQ